MELEHQWPVPVSQDDVMKQPATGPLGDERGDVLGGLLRESLGETHIWLQEGTDQLKEENHLLSTSKFSWPFRDEADPGTLCPHLLLGLKYPHVT